MNATDAELRNAVQSLRLRNIQHAVASLNDQVIAVEANRLQEVHGLPVNVAWLVASQSASYVGQVMP